jgi:hypothetical protein
MFRLLHAAGFPLQNPLVEFADMTAVEAALVAAGTSRDEVRKSIRAHQFNGSERFLQERGIALPFDAHHALLEFEVFKPLRAEFPEAQFRVNHTRLEGLGYYRSFTLRISPQAPDGNRYPVVDGGFTDWTGRLLGNQKSDRWSPGLGANLFARSTYPSHP